MSEQNPYRDALSPDDDVEATRRRSDLPAEAPQSEVDEATTVRPTPPSEADEATTVRPTPPAEAPTDPYAAPAGGATAAPAPGQYDQQPYGQPEGGQPYGQPQGGQPYGQQPYGAQPGGYAAPPAGVSAFGPYTSWLNRVFASLIDGLVAAIPMLLLVIPGAIMLGIGSPDSEYNSTTGYSETVAGSGNTGMMAIGGILLGLGYLLAFGISIWNRFFRMGRTGYSIGKEKMGQRLLSESTGQPIGPLMAFVREIAHYLDGLAYIGYLWPLWDAKRQTFADKILSTVVVDQPAPPKVKK
ncbi:MAG: RDD family protein [Micrococcales bacterium]|nr:RDD family protein [Micrococcales bacterium]